MEESPLESESAPQRKEARYVSIEGFEPPVGYFTKDDLGLIKAVAGCSEWAGTLFEDNSLNIRLAYETRIKHADEVKRVFVLKLLGYSDETGGITGIPQELSKGIKEVIPKDSDPEIGRLIRFKGGKIEFGSTVRGTVVGLGSDLDEWPIKDFPMEIDFRSRDSITEVIGQVHSHPNYRYAWDELKRLGKIEGDFPERSRIYSAIPSLADLINHVTEPEFVVGFVVAGDGRATLILRPSRFLEHFKRFQEIPQEEIDRFVERAVEISLNNGPEEENEKLAEDFANRVGLKLIDTGQYLL